MLVDGAWDALARRLRHKSGKGGIRTEVLDDCRGIGIEVEEPSAARNRSRQIAEIIDDEAATHVVDVWCQADDPGTVR